MLPDHEDVMQDAIDTIPGGSEEKPIMGEDGVHASKYTSQRLSYLSNCKPNDTKLLRWLHQDTY